MDSENEYKVSRFRQILPQVLASTVKNFLLLDLGLSVAFPTIVIPALMGLNIAANPNELLYLSAAQASWLGSIADIFKLLGSVISGWITDPIGRKRAMFIVNIPHLIGWTMMYNSTTLTEVFVAQSLFGFGIGLMEAPIVRMLRLGVLYFFLILHLHLTYCGEICEASVRGVIMALAGISATLGLFTVFFLGNVMEWRNVAGLCLILPIITMFAVIFIPETPSWLLSKKRDHEAMRSLQWLRGWVPEKAVQNEFEALKRYNENSNSCAACEKAKIKCVHPPPQMIQKVRELLRKRTLKPFIIIASCQMVAHFSGIHHLMPYIVPILNTYESPISPNWATVILGLCSVIATITCVIIVKFVGKRKIHLVSITFVTLINLSLGIYGFSCLPPNTKSYEHRTLLTETSTASPIPLILFVMLRFFTTGVVLVPFVMMSELFPFKSRTFATAITSAFGYIIGFTANKSFYNIEFVLSLPSALTIYGFIGFMGLIIAYKILPETENITLEDIERHFSENSRKLTDIHIQRTTKSTVENNTVDNNLPKYNETNAIPFDNVVNASYSNKAYVYDKN